MLIHSLTSPGTRLGKSFDKHGVSSYPMVGAFTSEDHEIETAEDLYALVKDLAADGGCLIKGTLHRHLQDESRAGATVGTDASAWVCFDLDKVEGLQSPKDFMKMIGAAHVSHVVQYSSSYGLTYDGEPYDQRLSCHVFMLLDRPVSAPLLKQWLVQLNFQHPVLTKNLSLTKSNVALSYGLDVTTCQNDKLLYVASPVCSEPFKDAIRRTRITLVKGAEPWYEFPAEVHSLEQNRRLVQDMVNELRAAKGMEPRKKDQFKFVGSTEVLKQPGHSVVTSTKEDRGFTYLNLNGGDSWGYYHPTNNHEIVYNFKGEPNYLTKELAPDYYAAVQGTIDAAKRLAADQASLGAAQAPDAQGEDQLYYLAFSELSSGAYYRGFYDPVKQDIDLYPAKSETQLRHFLLQYGIELGEYVPTWEVNYDPHQDCSIDIAGQYINLYRPSKLVPEAGNWLPVQRLIAHVLADPEGVDGTLTQHFIEWLRCIVQLKRRTTKGWVLQGVQGTGKGILFQRVLRPILGDSNCQQVTTATLQEATNGWMQQTLLTLVDEAHLSTIMMAKELNDKLKNWMSEPMIQLREMYKGVREVHNYNNWIFASNHNNPVLIEQSDRRFNVGYYQSQPWHPSEADLAALTAAVPAFYAHLLDGAVDHNILHQVINTAARADAIEMSITDTAYAIGKLRQGDWQYFWDLLPANEALVPPGAFTAHDNFKAALVEILMRAKEPNKKGEVNVATSEMSSILQYALGDVPTAGSRFTRWLARNDLHTYKIWISGSSTRGASLPIYTTPNLITDKEKDAACTNT